jgi:signal transduction histidine kinase
MELMFTVLGCIFQQHDLRLVVLASALCLLACATALTIIARARAAQEDRVQLAWLAGAGAVAGCGIWATHLVAMLAYETGLPTAFHPGLTIVSAALAVVLCGAGFVVAARVNGALGGVITGIAISAMHYCGMAALILPAYAVWRLDFVIASVLIGVSLSGLALHVAVNRRGINGTLIATMLLALASVGLHFTGMSAVHYIPDGRIIPPSQAIHPFMLATVVAGSAAFIVAQSLIVALVDRHLAARAQGEALRMRNHIAELETTQEALKKTSEDLSVALVAAAQANHAKSAFLASMSHELRTPLNAVIGFSDTMVMEIFGPLDERYKSYAADIRDSGSHLLSLINDVLDLSRLDAGHAELQEELFDPREAVTETLRMVMGHAAKAGVTISTDFADGLPLLRADRRRIKQILLNLLSNAVKFTPAQGRIVVRACLSGGRLMMTVEDTGIGIAAGDIPKALERFGQVDSRLARKYEGTGLGLPLSRQFAELHGGTLTLVSAPNAGTTVTMSLPPERLAARAETQAA